MVLDQEVLPPLQQKANIFIRHQPCLHKTSPTVTDPPELSSNNSLNNSSNNNISSDEEDEEQQEQDEEHSSCCSDIEGDDFHEVFYDEDHDDNFVIPVIRNAVSVSALDDGYRLENYSKVFTPPRPFSPGKRRYKKKKKHPNNRHYSTHAPPLQFHERLGCYVFAIVATLAAVGISLVAIFLTLQPAVASSQGGGKNKEQTVVPIVTVPPPLAPSPTAEHEDEPLLEDMVIFSHYIVQWGIETMGCHQLAWPPLELVCGAGNSMATSTSVVAVLERRPENSISCHRNDSNNKIMCYRTNYDVSDSIALDGSNNSSDPPLTGTLLVVCGTNGNNLAGNNDLDLQLRIPLDTYAQDCDYVFSSKILEGSGNKIIDRHGGFAMPFVSMGRVCQEVNDDNDGDHNVRTDFVCEEGQWTVDTNGQQEFCHARSNCFSLQICQTSESCSGAPSCDINTNTILAETVDLLEGGLLIDPDSQTSKCTFSHAMSSELLWELTLGQMKARPVLDTTFD